MTAREDLNDWNGRWKITKSVMSCRSCQAQQKEIDRSEAFVHSSACTRFLTHKRQHPLPSVAGTIGGGMMAFLQGSRPLGSKSVVQLAIYQARLKQA